MFEAPCTIHVFSSAFWDDFPDNWGSSLRGERYPFSPFSYLSPHANVHSSLHRSNNCTNERSRGLSPPATYFPIQLVKNECGLMATLSTVKFQAQHPSDVYRRLAVRISRWRPNNVVTSVMNSTDSLPDVRFVRSSLAVFCRHPFSIHVLVGRRIVITYMRCK